MSRWIKITKHFFKYEEDAYIEEATKGTLPVYHAGRERPNKYEIPRSF